jgi:hypothetical protein
MRLRLTLSWLLGLTAHQPPFQPFQSTAYAVIASRNVSVANVSLDDLRGLLTLNRRFWTAGQRVVLVLPGEDLAARTFLLSKVYKSSEAQLKRLFLEHLYQGDIDAPPKTVDSYREMLDFVAASRGVIAVVPADQVGSSAVITLRIDGKLPGEPGYSLHQ